ncbi:MAG: alcohol dehydrogenase catalytic domain-containing protein [Actinobacteria bacterium]|nr:alcohol dehydrogenase catalytic domain-containing protein [Actinomycetota bacterium]
MRAVVLTDAPPALEVVDVADPSPAADEVVVAVTACGICGSDLHVASRVGRPGTILGHEIAGTVAALGIGVDPADWHLGQPVAVRPFGGCGTCRWCLAGRADHCARFELVGLDRPGGFAERLAVPARELFALPASVTGPEQALVEPLAIARRALRRTGDVTGQAVLVLGAGPIGLATIMWARLLGARTIVASDPSPGRRDLAVRVGADAAVDPATGDPGAATVAAAGRPADAVVECTGRADQIARAMDHAAIDGRVTVVGLCLAEASIFPFTGLAKELDVRFSIYYGREDFTDTLGALDHGTLDPAIVLTETVALDQVPERFARLVHHPDGGKVAIVP